MTYVMSDIHGNERRFNSVMKQIKLQPEDTLYVLGDVVDRHPGGIRILRRIMAMPNAKMLLGNHEYMMLNALAPYDEKNGKEAYHHQDAVRLWYNNSGRITHYYYKHNTKAARAEILNYLKSVPLTYEIEVNGIKYRLVHAAPIEFFEDYDYKRDYHNAVEFAVWNRWYGYIPSLPDHVLILGHTPTIEYQTDKLMKIWKSDSVIDIDCGSGFVDGRDQWYLVYGRLGCLRLDDMKEFYSEENIREEDLEK